MLSLSKSSKDGEAAVIGGKKAWDTLCAALVEMGQPVEVPRMSPLRSTNLEEYRDFMYRNADRNTESVQNIFTDVAIKVCKCLVHTVFALTLQNVPGR